MGGFIKKGKKMRGCHNLNFSLSLSQFSKFSGNISDSFKYQKFWTHNLKVTVKDKKVNIEVTES
jgi:hypothetical protein